MRLQQQSCEQSRDPAVPVAKWMNRQKVEDECGRSQERWHMLIPACSIVVAAQRLDCARRCFCRCRHEAHLTFPIRQHLDNLVVTSLEFTCVTGRSLGQVVKFADDLRSDLYRSLARENPVQGSPVPSQFFLRSVPRTRFAKNHLAQT